jgi:hypothetical protein
MYRQVCRTLNEPHVTKPKQESFMDDATINQKINELAREEHELFERQAHGTASDADRERLRHLQVVLDQCWDLLRQRRARREFGQDPDEAHIRDEKTVEGYIG